MRSLLILSVLFISSFSFAGPSLPACKAKNQSLEFNNQQVLEWREAGVYKLKSRAFIQGRLHSVLENRQGHIHFLVDLDQDFSTSEDRIEVIYNVEFGDVPDYKEGDLIIACGDFETDPYSPTKAVIHWLHKNPKKNNSHEDGFLVINEKLTGL